MRDRALATLLAAAMLLPAAAVAAPKRRSELRVDPGTVVRWSEPGAKRCGMGRRSWRPLEETCYYPIDLLEKAGPLRITLRTSRRLRVARIVVNPFPYGTEDVDLGDIPQAHPSPEDLERNVRDQAAVAKLFRRREGPARFTLPLATPVNPLPEAKTFGWYRVFNGIPSKQPHTGADYAVPLGTPVLAAADGTVLLAEDLFYSGQSVFLDHGDGLFTMYFHLSEVGVQPGQDVAKGDRIGVSGSTGRSSGPHLFFGVRWHGARIDPRFLLGGPKEIPEIEPPR